MFNPRCPSCGPSGGPGAANPAWIQSLSGVVWITFSTTLFVRFADMLRLLGNTGEQLATGKVSLQLPAARVGHNMSLVRLFCRSVQCLRYCNSLPIQRKNVWTTVLSRKYCSLIDERIFADGDEEEEGAEDDEEAEFHEGEEDDDSDFDEAEYEEFVPRNLRLPSSPHNLLIIQPKVKYGEKKTALMKRTTPELQLEEACTLAESLNGWKVVNALVLGTSSPTRRLVFGQGTNQDIEDYVRKNQAISAIFYSINMMYGWTQAELENMFHVPVYDRFSIVLHIFKERAKTREAKLQLALAELPYVKTRLREASQSGKEQVSGAGGWFGSGQTFYKRRIEILKERERRIKKKIAELKVQRQVSREKRQKLKIPTVAIVGYTNCGKTSLIKALTGSKSLVPLDKLFATVDVRLYPGRLDRIHNVLYIDTIGFIADIPTDLIESFKSTLDEVNLADLIIHVQDVSHPDLTNQRETVHATLKSMDVSHKLLVTMAEVGNKIDKLPEAEAKCREAEKSVDLMISATKETNLNALKDELEKRLLINMGCFLTRVRIGTGGEEYSWLLRNSIILSAEVDDSDHNYTLMDIRFTEAVAGKFRRQFGTSCFIRKRDEDQKGNPIPIP